MLFSILIPTYNNESSIADAISSALEQVYDSESEVIVSNNASTDETLEIINSFHDSRLKVISNEQTVHMYENHNILLNYAKGDYVIFLHADDTLLPHALSIIAKRLQERDFPIQYMLNGRSMYADFSYNSHCSGVDIPLNSPISGAWGKLLFLKGAFSPSGTCFSRAAMVQNGGFPIIPGTFASDWIFELDAIFHNWEYEMIDRLLFVRTQASTFQKMTKSEVELVWDTAAQWYYSKCSQLEQKEIEQYWLFHALPHWDCIFMTKERRLTKQMSKYKKNPLRISKLVKWLLIKLDFR